MRSFWMSASFFLKLFSLLFFCLKLLYIGKKRTFRFFSDWFFFAFSISVFLFPVIAFNFYKIYFNTLRHFGIAYNPFLCVFCFGCLNMVNSESTTVLSSKHMRLLGITWAVYVCRKNLMENIERISSKFVRRYLIRWYDQGWNKTVLEKSFWYAFSFKFSYSLPCRMKE